MSNVIQAAALLLTLFVFLWSFTLVPDFDHHVLIKAFFVFMLGLSWVLATHTLGKLVWETLTDQTPTAVILALYFGFIWLVYTAGTVYCLSKGCGINVFEYLRLLLQQLPYFQPTPHL
jgi:hypothetical protein